MINKRVLRAERLKKLDELLSGEAVSLPMIPDGAVDVSVGEHTETNEDSALLVVGDNTSTTVMLPPPAILNNPR
jgi:hypothetical protein